jgi:hypothetical protein
MFVVLSDQPEEIKRFRSAPWLCQKTFETPLKSLDRFVEAFLVLFPLESGALSTDLIVFEPRNMLKLMADSSIKVKDQWRFTIRADRENISELLTAALGDWIDFLFVPSPESFALYSDHDEYTTFYTHAPETLLLLTSTLEQIGIAPVSEYRRGGPIDHWR